MSESHKDGLISIRKILGTYIFVIIIGNSVVIDNIIHVVEVPSINIRCGT